MSQSKSTNQSVSPQALDPTLLLSAINRVPDATGMGIVLIDRSVVQVLRAASTGGSDIILERRRQTAAGAPAPRSEASSAPAEWLSFGFNCGGAALAWVGVIGTTSLAPVTGELSLVGTGLLYAGALGASGACAASIYRVGNIYRGRTDINETLDRNNIYYWTMLGADVVGLVGAHGALTEVRKTGDILASHSLSWTRAANDPISRPMRRQLTEQLELQGAKRVSAHNIHSVVKQRMLDGIAGALGATGSAMTGAIHETIVWIRSKEKPS